MLSSLAVVDQDLLEPGAVEALGGGIVSKVQTAEEEEQDDAMFVLPDSV